MDNGYLASEIKNNDDKQSRRRNREPVEEYRIIERTEEI